MNEKRSSWSKRAGCLNSADVYSAEKPNRLEYGPICAACPVKDLCLAHAIANKEKGIWGGMTKLQRDKLPTLFMLSLNLQEVPRENVDPELEAPKENLYPIEKLAQLEAERRKKKALASAKDSKELLDSLDAFLLSLPDISSLQELLAE